jgi:hypothetical protein
MHQRSAMQTYVINHGEQRERLGGNDPETCLKIRQSWRHYGQIVFRVTPSKDGGAARAGFNTTHDVAACLLLLCRLVFVVVSGRYNACQRTKSVKVPQNAETVAVEWTVGGALPWILLDETSLVYGKWSYLLPDGAAVSCMTQPDIEKLSMLTSGSDQLTVNAFEAENKRAKPLISKSNDACF